MFIAGHKMVIVAVAYFIVIYIAQNLSNFVLSKHNSEGFFLFANRHQCFLQTYKCKLILCQQEALLEYRHNSFAGNSCNQISAALTFCYITGTT